ncbi:hypothetical protein Jden_0216 [Jonesia denitrificans DSM 20603]|uniref:Lipoprotein n=1 Tax=Jonesia denitrificans (strain ATCC 14870 / DSM 20603 / BCRC 15368 / CIP 55.134 / JCM 11481 / NBRC 15587 / NCTC 10816 / Prevot 55134) TaxID=471856 RepID=C7QYP3_JONDD|nr:hypothetical protein Jden_0216 [Jonesia denitrificans DSM 20603]ASE08408.1 hypothetical protein CEP80_04135 [Jonesia denitrificans]SQH19863.1 Uncharacterised protein [Jonesia denitrificans]
MPFRRHSVIVVVLLASASVAGCSDAGPVNSDVLDHEGARKEYSAFIEKLDFPSGSEAPSFPAAVKEQQPDGTMGFSNYEKGYGESFAASQWYCMWEEQWLEINEEDPNAADEALTLLEGSLTDEAFTRYLDESTIDWRQSVLDKARLGDGSSIAQDVKLNCS